VDRELTDLRDPDPFVTVSAGRACCRWVDLVEMVEVVTELAARLDDVSV